MNYQIVNKTDDDIEFCGQVIPAKGSTCIHASFVKDEDLEGLEVEDNIVFLTAELSDEDKAKVEEAEALEKATAELSDEDKAKVEEAVSNGELTLQLKKDGELTANSIKAIEKLLQGE